ncbi:phosphate uptake regulator, PhoU [Staphylothermus marinus F1]|uniref:Phosphate uptake regulator, PhoU n=1 Tax=Staphylothermus marinus (strain ATCC 43588 / DSM 3639 / JCM 9404 / F1) TaxID=399550 RepID=A3DLZ0_STAMF|nr:phosphate uptake regulator PhoU [Staphylothermus marinus]ABN69650.1 phosphate uptake regulator, PhoU [Staphylothermus marinus F1]
MVEKRKIQKTGSSSYIVTLPKDWIDSMGLKSGDYVLIYEHEGKLIITPPKLEAGMLTGEIRVLKPIENDQVFRILVAMYLSGYSSITVTFDKNIPELAKRISELKNHARIKLAGIEVVDETYNSVMMKILLDLKELPLIRATRRLHLIVNNMLLDALKAFYTKDTGLAEAVLQRDDEADRFHFMIVRQLALALLDIRIMNELGISNPVEAINYRILARNLERIADHAVNIAKRTYHRPDDCVLCKETYDIGLRINSLFNKAMDGLYRLSRQQSEEVIFEAQEIIKTIDNMLFNKILVGDISDQEKIVLTMVFDSLRRITRYSSGIAEATLNIRASKSSVIEIK